MPIQDYSWVRTLLAVSIHVTLSLVAAWDIISIARGHGDLTVSKLIQEWSRDEPLLPLAVGLIMGHLFWPVR